MVPLLTGGVIFLGCFEMFIICGLDEASGLCKWSVITDLMTGICRGGSYIIYLSGVVTFLCFAVGL